MLSVLQYVFNKEKNMNQFDLVPDPVRHKLISIAKSLIRIIAFISLIHTDILLAGTLLIIAELFGILEELV